MEPYPVPLELVQHQARDHPEHCFTRPASLWKCDILLGDIVVERVARATLTNVDTLIDGLIDAPGLRPARDCRYGEIKFCILYLLKSISVSFYWPSLPSRNTLKCV